MSASACDRDRSHARPRTSWVDQPEFKTYPPDLPRVALPTLSACVDAEPQLASHRLISSLSHHPQPGAIRTCPTATAQPLTLARVALLLQLSFGITGHPAYKRAAPSSGGLCPSELFVLWQHSLYHFSPNSTKLTLIRVSDATCSLYRNSPLSCAHISSCTFFVACNLHRTGAKYGDRCYRYVAADVGHIVENMRLVALGLGLYCIVEPLFDDAAMSEFLGLDGVNEVVMAVVSTFSDTASPPQVDALAAAASSSPTVTPACTGQYVACCPPQDDDSSLGVTGIAHIISSLSYTTSPSSSPQSSAQSRFPPLTILSLSSPRHTSVSSTDLSSINLPHPPSPALSIVDCILARRSYRRLSPDPISPDTLHAMLLAVVTPLASVSTCVRLHVIVNRAGIEPGLYRAASAALTQPALARPALSLRLIKSGLLADAAQEAALDQNVIGNAAVVLIFSLSRRSIAAAGPAAGREYRHGYLEAGIFALCA